MKASDILRIARGEIGVTESPAGSNRVKYNTWYYGREVAGSAYPWCMVFVQWVFDQAGKRLYPLTASCGMFVREHRNTPRYVTGDWAPGDIVFFDFEGDGVLDHVGIVESWNGQTLVTIEGNTSMTSQDNGGAVMRRTDHGKYAVCAVRPEYDGEKEPEKEDGKMTGEEIYRELTEYINSLPESEWSKEEGGFAQAKENGITDGTYPRGFLTREQLFAVLNRLRLI